MIRNILIMATNVIVANVFAQVSAQLVAEVAKPKVWTKQSEFGSNAALSGTSPNWSGGAANNLAGNVFFNALAKADWGKTNWDNVLKLNVGFLSSKLTDINNKEFRSTKKNIDNFFFDSKYGYKFKAPKWLSAFAGLNIQTQLLNGFQYEKDVNGGERSRRTSSFFGQGTTMPSVGLEAKPVSWAFARLGLGAVKQTWVINQALYNLNNPVVKTVNNEMFLAGVKKGKYILNEIGFNIQAGLDKSFGKDKMYNLKVNYLGFSPYNFSKSNSPLDSRFDVGVNAKISKYINLNYTLISVFDKDLRAPGLDAWQNSWIFGLGFLYQL